jgi:hypothetical protein
MREGRVIRAGHVVVAFALCVIATAIACSNAPSDARIGVAAPDRAQFPPVAELLARRCGELDCHGSAQRNFKIYACEGLRLDPMASPGCPSMLGPTATATSDAEIDATYRSLVGLEPAVMSVVVHDHGAHPELLTFVRKARGEESHKGGALVAAGDDQDRCITSWLASQTDTDACTRAVTPATP